MKTKEAFSVAVSFIAVVVSIFTFAMTMNLTLEFTETTRFLFSFSMATFCVAAILAMSLGYKKALASFLRYQIITKIRVLLDFSLFIGVRDVYSALLKWYCTLRMRYVLTGLNSAMKRSFQRSRKKEPLLMAYRSFLYLQYRVDPNASEAEIKFAGDKAVATIPSVEIDTIVKAIKHHISENLSKTSIVKDIEKLQKSLDLVALTVIINETGINGAVTISVNKILREAFGDENIKRLYNALMIVKEELKLKPWMDRRLLRVVLVETHKATSHVV